MAGTPGAGSDYPWPPYPSPSMQGSESQRAQLEAALRVMREQRPQIAAEIGEYLYSLVLQGQLRDPIVLATCRRLYDHEQQVVQLEANLRAILAAPPPSANRASHERAPIVAPDADATRIAPGTSSGGAMGQHAQSGDAATIIQHAPPGVRDAQPLARRPADLDSGETVIAPVRRPEPVSPSAGKPAERRCTHCRMPLRASDTTCPVCGRPVAEQAVESPQCRRCGTELRPQDRTCPVCGTPRS